jgi:signal peptidase I
MTVVRIGERERKQRPSLLLRRVTPGMALLVILAIAALRLWVVETAIVEGRSMDNSLLSGDRVLVLKSLGLKRFDVVVLKDPQQGEIAIKRIVGLPGDTISMVPFPVNSGDRQVFVGSQLYVNRVPYEEPYASSLIPASLPPIGIPDNSYFVLGDNRDASVDSRHYGPVERSYIQGVAVAVVYPFARMGIIRRAAEPAAPVAANTSR